MEGPSSRAAAAACAADAVELGRAGSLEQLAAAAGAVAAQLQLFATTLERVAERLADCPALSLAFF